MAAWGAGRGGDQLGASAYATGGAVAFGSAPDLHTAAHEAAHVAQQRQGANLPAGIGRTGDRYERQADAVADAVVAGRSAEGLLGAPTTATAGDGVQLKWLKESDSTMVWDKPINGILWHVNNGDQKLFYTSR